jgi:hypothetical protein
MQVVGVQRPEICLTKDANTEFWEQFVRTCMQCVQEHARLGSENLKSLQR